MCKTRVRIICVAVVFAVLSFGAAQASWYESFDGATPDLNWTWGCFPDVTKTFTQTIKTVPGTGNKYVSVDETTVFDTGAGGFGSAFGMGFGSTEDFTDVRIGAVVNVVGDASHNYCGVAGRAQYFIDPDGSITGQAPGMVVAQTYIMHVNWDDGPTNLSLDLEKVVMMQNIMDESIGVRIPGIGHDRSYYAELDIVGSDPTYVTGSLYEYKGGPLVARTPVLVDTAGNDWWEEDVGQDAPFANGKSGVFGQNENTDVIGYHVTFDDVFAASDGPAAVNPSPANGASKVSNTVTLSWKEAAFATGRELWLGKAGKMEKVQPSPTGTTYSTGPLELGKTYQWRVDEIGPSGVVQGHTWSFATAECVVIDDFESYPGHLDIQAAWPHNIGPPYNYVFLETGTVYSGGKAMRYEYQNQAEPFFTVATKTLPLAQDWGGYASLSMTFRGVSDNVEQPIFLELEDSQGRKGKAQNPHLHAPQTESWVTWTVDLQDFVADNASLDLGAIAKISLGTGSGSNSGQGFDDRDTLYIDDLWLCPLRCFNTAGVDLIGDVNGDCVVDFRDLTDMGASWLNNGLSAVP